MAKNNKMPAIRFSGYTDAWEQRKLSEVVTINPKTELPDEFKYVDLESVVGTNLLGFQVIKKKNAPSRAQRLASYGDVFYQTVRPYQRNNYLFENVDKDMVFSTGYAQLRSKLDSYFLLTLVQNDNFVKVVLDNCTGTSYPAINGSELGKITVQIPSNEVEANQIGKVFRGIDKSITLHQRKLEKLKLTKKALLQKLFPKNGSNIPELRFKGFTNAWEQRKLGNLTQLITKGTTPKVKNIQNGINFIKVENISDDGVISINSYVSEEEHMNYLSRSILANNDILFSIAGTLGRTAIVKSHLLPANTNQALAIIRLNKSVDVEYINTFLKSNAIKTYIRKNPTVGAQPNLSLGQVSDLEINIPNYSEQKKISNLFSKFDLMITLHQRKLEMLKNVKKGLLQKMFV